MLVILEDAKTLDEAVFQAIGAASVCWDSEGVFESNQAKAIAEELLEGIREERWR